MAVLINFKICDNSQDCSGIEVCPTGTIFWSEKKKTIVIDNSKCIGCGKCKDACPVGAIHFAKDDKEYERIKKEIEEDPRRVTDLFIERYGAMPINPWQQVDENTFIIRILQSVKLGVLEIYDDNSIQCLLKSIPLSDILAGRDVKYRKMEVNSRFKKKYGVKVLPALLFFKGRKLLGKIEGYFEAGQKKDLQSKINEIFNQVG